MALVTEGWQREAAFTMNNMRDPTHLLKRAYPMASFQLPVGVVNLPWQSTASGWQSSRHHLGDDMLRAARSLAATVMLWSQLPRISAICIAVRRIVAAVGCQRAATKAKG
jgi:hypothetical protein